MGQILPYLHVLYFLLLFFWAFTPTSSGIPPRTFSVFLEPESESEQELEEEQEDDDELEIGLELRGHGNPPAFLPR